MYKLIRKLKFEISMGPLGYPSEPICRHAQILAPKIGAPKIALSHEINFYLIYYHFHTSLVTITNYNYSGIKCGICGLIWPVMPDIIGLCDLRLPLRPNVIAVPFCLWTMVCRVLDTSKIVISPFHLPRQYHTSLSPFM